MSEYRVMVSALGDGPIEEYVVRAPDEGAAFAVGCARYESKHRTTGWPMTWERCDA